MTTVLDLLGVALVALFAFFVWPPAALAVLGAASLFASYTITARGRDRR